VILALSLTSTVFAAASFTMNDLMFGSATQVRNQDVSQVLHIVNDGTADLTINLASTVPSIYNVRFSQSVVTVTSNSSVDVTVTSFMPLSQSSLQTDFVSGITATANVAGLSRTAKVSYDAISMLEVYKVSVDINGDDRSLHRGDVYSSDIIKAGADVKFTVYVRNNFGSVDDIEIDDVNLDIQSSGDLDVDESDSMNDLQYGDKDQVSFSSTIPTDAEDGDTYDITVRASGRDQNGAMHYDTYNARMEVQRPAHEITIKDIVLSPQSVTACNGKATLNVNLQNTGRNNEDKVHLAITNPDLGIDQRFYEMTIDKDDTLMKSYSFNIANTTAPGQYDIILTSLYDTNTESDTQVATLTVTPCPQTVVAPVVTSPVVVNPTPTTIPTIPQVVPTTGATPVYGSASFTDSPEYLIILVAAVIIVLAILIILLVKFIF